MVRNSNKKGSHLHFTYLRNTWVIFQVYRLRSFCNLQMTRRWLTPTASNLLTCTMEMSQTNEIMYYSGENGLGPTAVLDLDDAQIGGRGDMHPLGQQKLGLLAMKSWGIKVLGSFQHITMLA